MYLSLAPLEFILAMIFEDLILGIVNSPVGD
jgi:hypothetical protein